ncbi:integrin-binding adhesin P66 [Borreliella carolinensis]|uniref:Integrin-binding adhesin P66 n=1 Tax=Borreliella carolinensis TaxID=478174 RepID=A0ABY9E5D5_9SPIR|nr:integrin-binding adhesin P66 [Borreliella carolinensis]WKC90972.1 integrin-binding adhesin P66 [Borreliella carolinensis]WNY67907.1 integrin-binding adhesin P66 [Borreliella carolinensis]
MKNHILYKLIIFLTTSAAIFAADELKEKDIFKINPWMPTFGFENTSEFRLDMDELVPGFENKSKITIKLKPFEANPELGKDDPFSAYIKVEDLALKAEGKKGDQFKIDVGDITAQINMYDFFIKISTMTDFDFNKESLFSFAPMTGFKSTYYGFPSNDRIVRGTILARGTSKNIGTIQLGYKLPKLDLTFAIGGTGTGNRNQENDKDTPYNKTYQGILYGIQAKWKPIKNILDQNEDTKSVIAETPLELNFGLSGAYGNQTFNNSSITYSLKDKSVIGNDLLSPTLSNSAILASFGAQYKLGLTKINDKNTYLILQMGTDFGIDPFASDFSVFGHISKAANFKKDASSDPNKKAENIFDPNGNALNFSKNTELGIAFSTGASIGLAWNKDTGEKESWAVKGSDSYSTRLFGEQDKKSGVALGISYGQNLYRSKDAEKKLKTISENSFQSLNVEISSYEDNKKGIINGLGWITSIGLYDILRQKSVENYPTASPSANSNNQAGQSSTTQATTPNLTFEDAMKLGLALYLDYAIPITSISTEAYVVPYIGAYILGPSNKLSSDATKIYLKTGLSLEKLIRFTTISLGWDSNNIIELANKNTTNAAIGSAFLQFKIAYSGS